MTDDFCFKKKKKRNAQRQQMDEALYDLSHPE
jgi:hypothetical protein